MKPTTHPAWLTLAMAIMAIALVFNLFGSVAGYKLETPRDWPADTHLLATLASFMLLFYTMGLKPVVDGIISHPDKEFWRRHLLPAHTVYVGTLSLALGNLTLLLSSQAIDYRVLPLLFALLANALTALRGVRLADTVKGIIHRKIEWIENYRL